MYAQEQIVDSQPLKPQLALWIHDCSCVCGNKWTHSYVTMLMGGTPTPQLEYHGEVIRVVETITHHTNHCYRCVNLALLNKGWSKPTQDSSGVLDSSVGGANPLDYTPRSRPSSRSVAHKRREALDLNSLNDSIFGEEDK